MYLIYQRIQARRCLCWAIAIILIIGVADYNSFKTSQQELREYAIARGDYGYYFTSAESVERKFVGRTLEVIDGHYRMATEVIRKDDGRMEAKYDLIATLKPDGAFYQTLLGFNEEGICDYVSLGKEIKDRNSLLLKHLPGVQTIMGWDWLTWHVQEGLYVLDYKSGDHAWYVNVLLAICYIFAITIWAMAPPFLPVLLLLSCLMFSFTRHIRNLIKMLVPILLIGSAYIWMVGMLSWGYPWLIGLPVGFCVVMIGMSNLMSILDDEGANVYLKKSDSEVLEQIKPFIADHLGVAYWEVVPEAKLGDDLGCDDLDFYEIIEEIEKELKIALPKGKFILNKIKTVNDLIYFIKKYN